MFGYVRPFTPELKVSEYEQYRAVYCGLCRQIGHFSGQPARFLLTYDIVLLCSVRMVLEGLAPEYEQSRCFAHPTKKRLVLKSNSATEFTAAVFSSLVSSNITDDLHDEHGIRKLKPIVLSPLAAHLRKCGSRRLSPEVIEKTDDCLSRLSRLENEKCPSADETSSLFGELLGTLFSAGLDGEKHDIAEVFGSSVGKFIYMCDAADDLTRDIRYGRYNPLYYGWGDLATEDGKISPLVKDAVRTGTMLSILSLEDAAEKLDPSHPLTPIIKNTVYLGFDATIRKIFKEKDDPPSPATDSK